MDTIKNYLETMFMNLPGTPEVYKAKNELRQMMEDKYEELIREGKSENEAVGTVISEFGNLDELAKDLGIDQVVSDKEIPDGRLFSMDEVRAYLTDSGKYALRIALGVFLCVFAAVPPIFMEAVGALGGRGDVGGSIGTAFMFVCVAVAVGIFIYSNVMMGKWDFMKQERLVTDFATTEYVHQEYNNYKSVHAMILTIGIILIIISFVPAIVLDALFDGNAFFDDLSGALIFAFVAMGVFLIVWTSNVNGSFARLLSLNDRRTIGGNFTTSQKEKIVYSNKTIAAVMSVYWPTVTCIYLCWSFLTFAWYRTWIIWPIAAIVEKLIQRIWIVSNDL